GTSHGTRACHTSGLYRSLAVSFVGGRGCEEGGLREEGGPNAGLPIRGLGISLKHFPLIEPPDWEELAKYAASLLPEEADSVSAGNVDGEADDDELAACGQTGERLMQNTSALAKV